jgi:hypothetical protein
MVNLDDPKEFFRVIVDPNLQEFYANEGHLRLGVNSILTLDALVARTTPRKLPEKPSRSKRQSARARRRVSRDTCGQIGRISDRPGYSSGCEARNFNPSNAATAPGSPSSRPGRLRCGRRNDEGGRRLAGQARPVCGATRRKPGQTLIGRASKRSPIRIRVVVIRASGYVDGGMGKARGILKT